LHARGGFRQRNRADPGSLTLVIAGFDPPARERVIVHSREIAPAGAQ